MGPLQIAQGVGGVIGNLAQLPATWLQNKQQQKLQQNEFNQNKKMWELNNQYNSPEMQMARLEAAGLNKNLVYGKGSVVGNTSSEIPKYSAPQVQRLPLETISPLDQLGKFLDLRTKNAQANLAESTAKVKEAEAGWIDKTIITDLITKMHGNKKLAYETAEALSWNKNMPRGKIGSVTTGEQMPYMKSFQADVRSKEQNNALRQFELDFQKKWGAKSGMNTALQLLRAIISIK